jgi:membrane-associated phospholipid phosphatase
MSRPGRSPLLVVVGGAIVLFACLLLFGAIAEEIGEQEANALDAVATPLMHSLSNPTLDEVVRTLTNLGSTVVLATLCLVGVILLGWRRHWREALFLSVSLVGSLALMQSLKLIFHRPRPQLDWAQAPPEYSFPSGHSMNAVVFYGAIALIVWTLCGPRAGRIAALVTIVLALLIGASRIYLGVHYFTDVAGGFLAGVAWLLIVSAAFEGGLRLRIRRAGPPET